MNSTLEKKYVLLQSIFEEMQKVILAYSGGVDSALLLKIGTDIIGNKCIGVLGVSPSLSTNEYQDALDIAQNISANIEIIKTHELDNDNYNKNDEKRCFYCKYELFTHLKRLASEKGIKYIIDGSNADDVADYRPGMQAASSQKIRSPFIEAKLTKSEIREISRNLKLPTWEKPAQPCLASRVAYGQKISSKLLHKIEQSERVLKDRGYKIVRVRYYGDFVSIEVGQDELERLINEKEKRTIRRKLSEIGFSKVKFDKSGYKSGKLNKYIVKS